MVVKPWALGMDSSDWHWERCGLGAHGGGGLSALACPARLRVCATQDLEDARRWLSNHWTMRLSGTGDVIEVPACRHDRSQFSLSSMEANLGAELQECRWRKAAA